MFYVQWIMEYVCEEQFMLDDKYIVFNEDGKSPV